MRVRVQLELSRLHAGHTAGLELRMWSGWNSLQVPYGKWAGSGGIDYSLRDGHVFVVRRRKWGANQRRGHEALPNLDEVSNRRIDKYVR